MEPTTVGGTADDQQPNPKAFSGLTKENVTTQKLVWELAVSVAICVPFVRVGKFITGSFSMSDSEIARTGTLVGRPTHADR